MRYLHKKGGGWGYGHRSRPAAQTGQRGDRLPSKQVAAIRVFQSASVPGLFWLSAEEDLAACTALIRNFAAGRMRDW